MEDNKPTGWGQMPEDAKQPIQNNSTDSSAASSTIHTPPSQMEEESTSNSSGESQSIPPKTPESSQTHTVNVSENKPASVSVSTSEPVKVQQGPMSANDLLASEKEL